MIHSYLRRLIGAGLTTGITDGLFACVLSAGFYGSTITRLWQAVASTLLGKSAYDGGTRTALIGVLMHFGVAFFWSGVFLLLTMSWAWLRRVVDTRGGVFAVAAVYGPFVWLVMSIVVIPLLVHRPPTFATRWWIQLIGHAPFVGLPIVAWVGGGLTTRRRP
ncbi:MAG TPA: hypothetical protein VGQ36_25865 [Thermoanaerobaculia bacterium]|jgi:hypothetical protein|nr:hypothetical protein [Thermoanaerobaculia bacterium]